MANLVCPLANGGTVTIVRKTSDDRYVDGSGNVYERAKGANGKLVLSTVQGASTQAEASGSPDKAGVTSITGRGR